MATWRGWRNPYFFLPPLLISCSLPSSKLHQRDSRVQEMRKRISPKKSDHLVLGPAAGQGLLNRLQCNVDRHNARVLSIEGDYSRGNLMLHRIRMAMMEDSKFDSPSLRLENWP